MSDAGGGHLGRTGGHDDGGHTEAIYDEPWTGGGRHPDDEHYGAGDHFDAGAEDQYADEHYQGGARFEDGGYPEDGERHGEGPAVGAGAPSRRRARYDFYDDPRHRHDLLDYDDDAGWPVVDGPEPAHRSRGDRRDGGASRRSGHPFLKALAVLVVVVVVVIGGGLVWAQNQIDPGGHPGASVTVDIPPGSTTSQIGHKLASAGVIHNGSLFALYVHLHSDTLLPGTYTLQKNLSYTSAINLLKDGPKILTEKLVIPEGYTLAQIAKAVAGLPHMGLSAEKFLAAAKSTVRSPYEPAGTDDLEGLLFPATYDVSQGQTETDVLEKMIGAFDEQATALGLSAAAQKLGMSPYQVVIVASIVEREAKLPGDRGNVASAIYNRLKIGMKLGADSTQAYYLRLSNPNVVPTAAQDDQPSPYNTRLNPGLPPTAIANPGLASLQAAADPPKTSYLYWVEVNPDGQLGFASDNAGFEQLQAQCRAAGLC